MKWLSCIGNNMKLIENCRHWLLQKLLGDKFSYFEKDIYTILSNEKYRELKSIDEKRLSIQKTSNDIQEHWIEMQKNRRPEQVTEARFFLTPSEALEFANEVPENNFDVEPVGKQVAVAITPKGPVELGAH